MALLRRQLRTRIINALGLRRDAVVSHTAGAISVMVRPHWGQHEDVDSFTVSLQDVLGEWGWDTVVVRSGATRRGVWYATVTEERLAEESLQKYGNPRMVNHLQLVRLAGTEVAMEGGRLEVGEVEFEDLDGDLNLPDVLMEDLEESEV